MYGTLREFASFIKYKKCFIDNETFRLHYRYTFTLLLIASFFTAANQYIGRNISCMAGDLPSDVIDSFCWIQGTFTIPSQINENASVMDGVSNPTASDDANGDPTKADHEDEVHHAWYQWVCFVLFLQAMMCYIPHHLWKSAERGKLAMIIDGLDKPKLEDKEEDKTQAVARYLATTRGTHSKYAYKFIFYQFMNLFNVLLQVYLMDVFLGYQFTTYGTEVLTMSQRPVEERNDPMAKVFPRVTKCTWKQYGQSGTLEIKDAICILSINIINEKIYIFLWFWFIMVIVFTAISLMCDLVLVSYYNLRLRYLSQSCRSALREDIDVILKRGNYGDWFLLMQMVKHVDPLFFEEVIKDLRNRFAKHGSKSVRVPEVV